MPIVAPLVAFAGTAGGAATIGAATSLAGGAIAASGSRKAAKTQAAAARQAEQTQREMFEKQLALQEPFRQGGITAQQQLMQLLGIGGDASAEGYGSMARPFGQKDFEQDPGYAFRQSEGMRALERSASARGGLLSGGTMKGIQRFGQDLASQEYGNAFNRFQVERAARLNPLQSLLGSGQSATNMMTGAAGQAGQGIAGAQLGQGQARASGYVGEANALGGALGSIGQAASSYPLYQAQINYMNRQPGPSQRPYTGSIPTSVLGSNFMGPRD